MKTTKSNTTTIIILAAIFLFVVFLSGRTGQKGNEQGQTDGKQGEKAIVLKFSSLDYTDSILGKGQDMFLKMIEERTNIKFERYFGGTLLESADTVTGTGSGITDVSMISTAYDPSKFRLSVINNLPLASMTPYSSGMALHDLIGEIPAVKEEWTKNNIKYLTSVPIPSFVIMTNVPVKDVGDLKRLKLRASGQFAVFAEKLGAIPVTMLPSEAYEAMERGTIDGCIWEVGVYHDFGLTEVTKYIYNLPLGGLVSTLSMNLDKWNSLSKEYQDIIEGIAQEHIRAYHDLVMEGNKRTLQTMKDAGVEIIEASDEDIAYTQKLAKELWEEWANKLEKGGLPGKEVLEKWAELSNKYQVD